MKTLLAFLVAILGFGVTLAWSAEAVPATSAAASQAAPAQRVAPKALERTGGRATPVPAFNDRLLQGPTVLCACGPGRSRA